MRRALLLFMLLLAASPGHADDLVLRGGMDSRMGFTYQRDIAFAEPVQSLTLSFVAPETFASPTYSQRVERFDLVLDPPPDTRTRRTDARGNEIVTATWKSPPGKVAVKLTVDASSETKLARIDTRAPFPPAKVPPEVRPYLRPTAQVQSQNPAIAAKAQELTAKADTEAEAAKAIADFVSDRVRYINPPERFDALYSLETGKGNCQNYSHLAAALMRAVGIPARIVNGFTMDKPYSVARKDTVFTLKGGQGRHSWIEVWFPDLGWVPFDPLKTSMFVSTRYLRVEIGLDNEETRHDGRVLWTRPPGSKARPRLRTSSGADFPRDDVRLTGTLSPGGARTMVLLPEVRAVAPEEAAVAVAAPRPTPPGPAAPVRPQAQGPSLPDKAKPDAPAMAAAPIPAAPKAPTVPGPAKQQEDPLLAVLKQLESVVPGLMGKPQTKKSQDRPPAPKPTAAPASPSLPQAPKPQAPKADAGKPGQQPQPAPQKPGGSIPGAKPVEPAPPKPSGPIMFGNLDFPEDVDFTDYGEPKDMGGGSFELTRNFMVETAQYVTGKMTQYAQVFEVKEPMDLSEVALALHRYGGGGSLWVDVYGDADGQPGELVAASDLKDVDTLSYRPGYRWERFAFTKDRPRLKPGMYWVGLGFTGDPVVNWFYTFGKPVGPVFGTRYKGVFDDDWSGALDFEFNYMVQGKPDAG